MKTYAWIFLVLLFSPFAMYGVVDAFNLIMGPINILSDTGNIGYSLFILSMAMIPFIPSLIAFILNSEVKWLVLILNFVVECFNYEEAAPIYWTGFIGLLIMISLGSRIKKEA